MKLLAVSLLSIGTATLAAPLTADPALFVTFYSCASQYAPPNTFSCFAERNTAAYAHTCVEPKETEHGRIYNCGGISLTMRTTSGAMESTRGHLYFTSGLGNIVSDCKFDTVEGEEHNQLVCSKHEQ